MGEIERIIGAAYDVGALSVAEGVDGLYLARGWLAWEGPTAVLAPDGLTRTEDDDDSTFVFPAAASLVRTEQLACDWRDGDVW